MKILLNMRLFIAIDANALSSQLNEIRQAVLYKGVKPTPDYHLTLKFLGDVKEDKIAELTENLRSIKFKAFKQTIVDIGAFPTLNKPNVVWVGIKEKTPVTELFKQIDAATAEYSMTNKFHPHITIARVKFLRNAKSFKDCVLHTKVKPEFFEVSSFQLIKSELTKEGPIYNILESFKSSSIDE